ncbi:uncharacterized protein LOC116779003 [Danaus plexippus]|uniref:uncharacterized protein LOC116779003 n=1 Tax=Danaus plexippus TaxID=13037 RepID=UPI002AAFC7BF|nr:uncharacterized protein LOC116779003 [Danaus plexippus]
MSIKVLLTLFLAFLALANGANILDFLDFEDGKKLIEIPELRNDQPNRNCMCKGPACVCCVDFNITIVDLGGPGCVHMKYDSPEEGFSVNVSYGKNLIHSSKLQGANPAPICLEVFGKFAQVCAKFNDLAPTSDGLRGCLELEPRLLGEAQLDFPIGCFKSTPGGMEMEDPPEETEETTEETTAEENNGFDAESFLMNVFQTAEQGVAFLSSLLDFPSKRNETTTIKPITSTVQETENSQRRAPKNLRHPNQL